jgi:L-ascorbate metabolism protein UlaG (beta-lactamase superfamily)
MAVRLRYLGISGFELVSPEGVRVVVDPCVTGDASLGLAPSPVAMTELGDVDLVLVSHGASDHYGDTAAIATQSGGVVACAPDVRLRLLHDGVPDERIRKLLPGVTRRVGDVAVTAWLACHISFHRVDGQWVSGLPLCFVVDLGGTKIFHAGDTALFGDLRTIGEVHAPDVALLPVGATEPDIEFMTPEHAAIALEWLGARTGVPMHHPPSSGAADAFAAAVAARGLTASVARLAPGEHFDCDAATA